MYPQPPPPPKKPAAGSHQRDNSGSDKHKKNLGGKFNEAMRPAPAAAAAPPVEEMAKMNIHKKSMAVGGTVGPTIRRPHNHRMIGIQSFEYGKIKAGQVGFIDDASPKFAQATFYQGGYFAGADHQLI
jgi:hypothetical protein